MSAAAASTCCSTLRGTLLGCGPTSRWPRLTLLLTLLLTPAGKHGQHNGQHNANHPRPFSTVLVTCAGVTKHAAPSPVPATLTPCAARSIPDTSTVFSDRHRGGLFHDSVQNIIDNRRLQAFVGSCSPQQPTAKQVPESAKFCNKSTLMLPTSYTAGCLRECCVALPSNPEMTLMMACGCAGGLTHAPCCRLGLPRYRSPSTRIPLTCQHCTFAWHAWQLIVGRGRPGPLGAGASTTLGPCNAQHQAATRERTVALKTLGPCDAQRA
jgi:hypothetical protein